MPIHEDQQFPARTALEAFNSAVLLGLADAAILADTNLATFLADFDALVVHEDKTLVIFRIKESQRAAFGLGILTDSGIAAADTVAGIRALYTTALPGAVATQQGSRLWGE